MTNASLDKAAMELAKKEARREYHRQWRQRNPEKVKANRERYWEKKGREYLESLSKGEK